MPLIDVKAAGLNFPDVLLSYGKYQFKPEPPFILGGEAAGVVAAVGAGVTAVAPGDRVATWMVHGAFAAAGGVGTAAVELGKLLGGKVIAAASTDEKVAFCK